MAIRRAFRRQPIGLSAEGLPDGWRLRLESTPDGLMLRATYDDPDGGELKLTVGGLVLDSEPDWRDGGTVLRSERDGLSFSVEAHDLADAVEPIRACHALLAMIQRPD